MRREAVDPVTKPSLASTSNSLLKLPGSTLHVSFWIARVPRRSMMLTTTSARAVAKPPALTSYVNVSGASLLVAEKTKALFDRTG